MTPYPPASALELNSLEPFTGDDRVLILAPHPDDESIACAGVIQQAKKAGADVHVIYLTNGDHNEFAFIVYEKRITFRKGEFIHMGEIRRKEAIRAMKLFGLKEADLTFLGYPDFGTFKIFSEYWQTNRPYWSMLTRIAYVPYKGNLSYGAPYVGQSVLNDLKNVLLKFKPNKIFVSHPADTNPDHRSLYLFLQIALQDLDKNTISRPHVYPYLVHCVKWPLPRRFHPQLNLAPPKNFLNGDVGWQKLELSKEEVELKRKATLCYPSQTQSSAFYLLSFSRRNELFGDYTQVELARQSSLKEKGVSFFGFSKIYPDLEFDSLNNNGDFGKTIGRVGYAVLDDVLLIRVEKENEIKQKLNLLVFLFGYKDNTPFAAMPKTRLIIKNNKVMVFNGKKPIKVHGVSLETRPDLLIIKCPLQELGNPDFILTSVKSYSGVVPVEASGFRKIIIE